MLVGECELVFLGLRLLAPLLTVGCGRRRWSAAIGRSRQTYFTCPYGHIIPPRSSDLCASLLFRSSMAAGAGVTAAAEEESTSFVLDPEGHFYVQDQFAVYANGVRRSDNKVFGVDLSTLKVEAAIGRGACGVVRRAVHVPTGTLVALKVRNHISPMYIFSVCSVVKFNPNVAVWLTMRPVAATTTRRDVLQEIPISDKGRRKQIMQELSALYDADCVSLIGFHGAFYTEVRSLLLGALALARGCSSCATLAGPHHHLLGVHGRRQLG